MAPESLCPSLRRRARSASAASSSLACTVLVTVRSVVRIVVRRVKRWRVCPSDPILRYYREGRIPGRRLPGQIRPVRFLWSEVESVWDGEKELTVGDAA